MDWKIALWWTFARANGSLWANSLTNRTSHHARALIQLNERRGLCIVYLHLRVSPYILRICVHVCVFVYILCCELVKDSDACNMGIFCNIFMLVYIHFCEHTSSKPMHASRCGLFLNLSFGLCWCELPNLTPPTHPPNARLHCVVRCLQYYVHDISEVNHCILLNKRTENLVVVTNANA